MEPLKRLGWKHNEVHLCAMSFVDNLFFVGKTAFNATSMGDIFEKYLKHTWAQNIKPDSKEAMPIFASDQCDVVDSTWKLAQSMTILGQTLNNRGSIAEDFNTTTVKM